MGEHAESAARSGTSPVAFFALFALNVGSSGVGSSWLLGLARVDFVVVARGHGFGAALSGTVGRVARCDCAATHCSVLFNPRLMRRFSRFLRSCP